MGVEYFREGSAGAVTGDGCVDTSGLQQVVRDVGGNAENPGRNQGELRSWEEAGNPGRNREKKTKAG